VKEGTRNLLDKAARAIRAAEILVREGETGFRVGRAYGRGGDDRAGAGVLGGSGRVAGRRRGIVWASWFSRLGRVTPGGSCGRM
jgi:hypothetical protein